MNKGECDIINNKWQCKLESVGYIDFIYSLSNGKKSSNSIVKFDLKQNKLTIPYSFYNFILVGYRYTLSYDGQNIKITKEYNKFCRKYDGQIYCTCSSKDNFGVMRLYFNNISRLDIDLRDYVYYDNSAYYLKCRVDISTSNDDEFIIGLRGLNNTIISFDLDDNKIEFFHRKKADDSDSSNFLIYFLIVSFIAIAIFSIIKRR